MTKLDRTFYARDSETVAKDLLGRTIVCVQQDGSEKYMTLKEIAAYDGETETTSEGVLAPPGSVTISVKFGHCLIDIATGLTGQPSCVTLRGGSIDDVIAKGPGNVSLALGITRENKDDYHMVSIAGTKLWIEGDACDPTKIKQKEGNSANSKGIYKI